MKKKRTFLGVALLIAVLVLGVGYAAITKNLSISGTASATTNNENFKVKFEGTPVTDKTNAPSSTVEATVTNDLTATINVSGLTTTNDTVTATYTIKNESPELSADLAVGSIANDNAVYFEVTANLAASTIAKGDSTTVTVTVKLIKTPVEDQSAAISIPITATAKAA